jgi:lipopolysaccharide export system permease protein
MNRIDRYISGLFWSFFLGGLLVFVTIFVAVDAMSTMVTYNKASGGALLAYYGYSAPDIIYKMVPVACLLATILTLSSMNKANELVALYASGMSLLRINFSILLWVSVISVMAFFVGDRVIPQFTKNKNFIFYRDIVKNPSLYSTTKNDRIWYRSKDTIFNIKTLNEKAHKAQGLTLYYFNESWDLIQMMTAKEVDLKGATWELSDGSVTLFTEDSSFPLTSSFVTKTIVMGEDAKDLSSTGNTAEVLSLSELSEFIRRNKAAGLDTLKYEVDYHSKYGFAFAALVMCLLGIPFSVSKARSGGTMRNIGVCLGLVFVYWIFYSSGLTLGQHGQIPPILAAWAPNLLMGGMAGFVLLRK